MSADQSTTFDIVERLKSYSTAWRSDGQTPLNFALDEAVATINELRMALKGLVDRLDYVHADPAYKSVWMVSQLHVGPYTGPTYVTDLEKARHVLAKGASA